MNGSTDKHEDDYKMLKDLIFYASVITFCDWLKKEDKNDER